MFSFFRKKKKGAPVAPSPVLPSPGPRAPEPRPQPRPPAKAVPTVDDHGGAEIAALRARTSEELCGLAPGMNREEIHAALAKLFRRHNRAASSLDDRLRAEAEIMLEAIVDIRHRYLEAEEEADG